MTAPIPPPDLDAHPEFYASLARGAFYGDDPQLGEKAWGDVKIRPDMGPDETRALRAGYYGMVSLMDHHIGRILDRLEADGTIDETVIIFASDHGDYLGDHGLWGKGLPTYEAMQRVPLIVAHPDCQERGQTSHALQSLVDIKQSCLDAAGLAPSAASQGVSQKTAWIDPGISVRDHCLVEFRPAQGQYKQVTYVTDQHKLVLYDTRDYGELYDLGVDPEQSRNLYDDPNYQTLKAELAATHAADQEQVDLVRERKAVA